VGRLSDLEGEAFDVAVIGGGIIGCGIARDAALRGLRVALFEKRDFGSGTTSASTRIIHGGLRYLEMLDFGLVRMDLRERETLLRIAPHLVRPLEFLIPFFRRDRTSSLRIRAGLALYDALSGDSVLPSRRWLSGIDARRADSALYRPDVRGAAAYHDARVDSPERLALENVLDAERHGGLAFNYCEVVAATMQQDRVTGIRVRDTLDGGEALVTARQTVNATGAWLDPVATSLTGRQSDALRTTKGVHIVVGPVTRRALVLFSRVDRRLLFAIPRAGLTWIGTTDTDYAGDPAEARATAADVEYLITSVRHVFPSLTAADVLYTTAGVRALVRQRGAESSVSRMHKVLAAPATPAGLTSVLGGKITGYRAIAEDAVDAVCRQLGLNDRRATTAERPLPGALADPAGVSSELLRPAVIAHLQDLYGARANEVVALMHASPGLERPLSAKYPDIAAQVLFAVRHEHCAHVSDFLKRRTLLGASDDQGWDAAAPVATLMAAELGWSTSRVAEELVSYRREIASSQAFRGEKG
jgi:glycerol-3-phosphate dehydrogenase